LVQAKCNEHNIKHVVEPDPAGIIYLAEEEEEEDGVRLGCALLWML
jgi:hypothetical protein